MSSARPVITEFTYWSNVQLLASEIEEAIIIFHTAEEINRLLLRDPTIYRVVNEEPLFWQAYRSTSQTALFMALGRIFDSAPNSHSIHKVVSATMDNIQFFSRPALKARRTLDGREPDWLSGFVAAAWEPVSAADLRFLKRALQPHSRLFESVYRPIRNSIFGHRLMSNDQAGVELFPHTNREAVRGILDFLHELIDAIIDLYNNGNKPELGRRNFTEHNQRICDGARNVLRKLAANTTADAVTAAG